MAKNKLTYWWASHLRTKGCHRSMVSQLYLQPVLALSCYITIKKARDRIFNQYLAISRKRCKIVRLLLSSAKNKSPLYPITLESPWQVTYNRYNTYNFLFESLKIKVAQTRSIDRLWQLTTNNITVQCPQDAVSNSWASCVLYMWWTKLPSNWS